MKSQNTSVSFPDNSYRFLKIEISDPDNNPVDMNSVEVKQYVQKDAQQFGSEVKFEINRDDSEKTSIIIADMGQGGIPTSRLSFSTSGENFNRGASIYSSKSKNSSDWKYVGQGYIFRYNTPKFIGENLSLDINETTDRYIKIVIYNNDDEPLEFSKIEAFGIYKDIIFQAKGDKEYQLYYGNPKASYPKYDIDNYLKYYDLAKAQKITLGARSNNPNFVPEKEPEKPFSEKMPYFLPAALSVLGLILLFLVYKFLRK
jgi:hypothetical protein